MYKCPCSRFFRGLWFFFVSAHLVRAFWIWSSSSQPLPALAVLHPRFRFLLFAFRLAFVLEQLCSSWTYEALIRSIQPKRAPRSSTRNPERQLRLLHQGGQRRLRIEERKKGKRHKGREGRHRRNGRNGRKARIGSLHRGAKKAIHPPTLKHKCCNSLSIYHSTSNQARRKMSLSTFAKARKEWLARPGLNEIATKFNLSSNQNGCLEESYNAAHLFPTWAFCNAHF